VRPTPKGERFTIRGLRVPGAEGEGVRENLEARDWMAFRAGLRGEKRRQREKQSEKLSCKNRAKECGESFRGVPLSLTL